MAKILIVDDSKFARSLVKKILKFGGYKDIIEAVNGREGLKLALGGGVDCMILDLLMPEMDGIEVLAELKERGSTVPVIVVTSNIQSDIRTQCLNLGARGFIKKTNNRVELLTKLEELLNGNGHR